jgi:hypothetical protein
VTYICAESKHHIDMSVESISKKVTSWWGPGWTDRDYSIPTYSGLSSKQKAHLTSGFDVSLSIKWKERSSGVIRDYFDKWSLGSSFNPLTKFGTIDARLSRVCGCGPDLTN